MPVIAALHGVVFGGGLQIALGADIRYAAPDAKLSVMEIRWGIVPDMAGTWLLRELARGDVIRELAYTGRVVSGEEAVALGLATRVEAEPREAALATAREIAGKQPACDPGREAPVRARRRRLGGRLLLAESDEQAAMLGSPNQREAVHGRLSRSAPPVFRDPDGGPTA